MQYGIDWANLKEFRKIIHFFSKTTVEDLTAKHELEINPQLPLDRWFSNISQWHQITCTLIVGCQFSKQLKIWFSPQSLWCKCRKDYPKVRNDRASCFSAKAAFIFPAGRCICQEISNVIKLDNLTSMVDLPIFTVKHQHWHLTPA